MHSSEGGMLGELTNIAADTLIEMLFVIMMGTVALTATDITEIEQIQCELKRRREDPRWMLESVN
jgi:hypothetical protein